LSEVTVVSSFKFPLFDEIADSLESSV
jgi:hypothetical protein